jgi:arylsulfatase A-like enzyme
MTVDLYDGEVRYTDDLVAEVFDTLQDLHLAEKTVIVLTSDHGEQLGQHGMLGHGLVHEPVTHVPIILWGPGIIPAGRTYEGYVQ